MASKLMGVGGSACFLLLKPRLGNCFQYLTAPPLKRSGTLPPLRLFCPLWPRPEVFPLPDPIPRPLRRFCLIAPGLSCNMLSLRRGPSASPSGCWYDEAADAAGAVENRAVRAVSTALKRRAWLRGASKCRNMSLWQPTTTAAELISTRGKL